MNRHVNTILRTRIFTRVIAFTRILATTRTIAFTRAQAISYSRVFTHLIACTPLRKPTLRNPVLRIGMVVTLICMSPHTGIAQLISGNAFLKGNYVEVGLAPYGIWGNTVDAPAGYHARSGMTLDAPTFKKLGFVADPDKDGWDVGSPNKYNGDYFLPANPNIGWAMTIDGQPYLADRNQDGGRPNNSFGSIPPGSVTSVITTNVKAQAIWEGALNGINIKKTITVPIDKAYFTVRIVLTNTSSFTHTSIFYSEYLNPDNDGILNDDVNAPVDFYTYNTVVYQNPADNQALIKALGNQTMSYLGLGSKDCRARVARGPQGESRSLLTADQLYNGQGGALLTGTETNFSNNFIALAFSIGDLKPGDSTAVTYAYVLSEPDLDEALRQTDALFQTSSGLYHSGDSIRVCSGTTLPLAISNGDDFAWTWSPNTAIDVTTGLHVNVTVGTRPLTYSLDGIGACGQKNIQVTVAPDLPQPPIVAAELSYCINAPAQPLTATLPSSGYGTVPPGPGRPGNDAGSPDPGASLIWSTDPNATTGDPNPPTPVTSIPGSTKYYVRQLSAIGCISDTAVIDVINYPLPVVSITKTNDINCLNGSATLTASIGAGGSGSAPGNGPGPTPGNGSGPGANPGNGGGTGASNTYLWTPADGLSNPHIFNPLASPSQTTVYHVTASGPGGCTDTASITVHVASGGGSYLLSNAFTPNNDGHNDCFGLQRVAGSIGKVELSIYDRMGRLVFHTTNPSGCWDGQSDGHPAPAGTYVYFIRGSGNCGLIDQKGTVQLIR